MAATKHNPIPSIRTGIHTATKMHNPLAKVRTARQVSLSVLASAVSCTKGQLSRIERGESACSTDLAKRIAANFNNEVTRDEILFPELYAAKKPAASVPGRKPVRRATTQKAVAL